MVFTNNKKEISKYENILTTANYVNVRNHGGKTYIFNLFQDKSRLIVFILDRINTR